MSDINTIKKLNGLPVNKTETESGAVIDASNSVDIGNQLPSFADLLPEQALPYWAFLQQYPIVEASSILLIFWGLAYVIRRYVLSLIGRLTNHTDTKLDDYVFAQLRSPVFNTVILIGAIIASKSAGLDTGFATYITPICLTLIILINVRAAMNVSAGVITAFSRNKEKFQSIDTQTEPLLIITAKLLSVLVGAYSVLTIWGINPVGLLASAGIVGLAFGFAAKDTLANLFSGIFILADRPYRLGDYVNLASGERGKITHIGIRSTRLMTRDDIEITVPNGLIGNEKVVNESGGSEQKMRIRLPLQCAYESNLNKVHDVLMSVAEAEPEICQFPTPRVRFRGFGDSGIDVQLLGWIEHPQDRGRIKHQLIMAIHQAFEEHNIEIPYPRYVMIDYAASNNKDDTIQQN